MPAATTKQLSRILTVLLLLFLSASANAGLLSFLGKTVKKADAPDSPALIDDLSLGKLKLDGFTSGEANPIFLKAGIDGEWVFTLQNGERITDLTQLQRPLLVIDKAHLPRDLQQLSALPQDIPLVLRHNQHLFEVQRNPILGILGGKVIVPTPTWDSLQGALFHLASPWYRNKVYVASTKPGLSATPHIQGIGYDQLSESLSQLRGETLVVNGARADMQHLADQARRHDIQLIIFDGPVPAIQLEKLVTSGLRNNSIDGLLSLIHKNFPEIIPSTSHYEWQANAKHQIVIRNTTSAEPFDSATTVALETAMHSALLGVRIYRPDQARQQELDRRIVWWLHSDVFLYLVASFFAGSICFGTCREFLNWRWPRRQRTQYRWLISYGLVKTIRLMILLILIMPLFGLPCMIYRILYNFYQAVRWLVNSLLRAGRFVLRHIPGTR